MNNSSELLTGDSVSIPHDKKRKREFWCKEVDQWRLSGESQSHYSRRRGFPLHQFNYWVGKLSPKESTEQIQKPLGKLLSVQVSENASKDWLIIKRNDGMVLEVPLIKNIDYLKVLLEALGC